MITIKELADLCGVSIATVSRAMNARADVNPQTRRRILAAAEKYGYVPNPAARSLKVTAPRTVAVIVQGQTSELLISLLAIIDEEIGKSQYETMLFHVADRKANAQTISQLLAGGNFSGIIFLGRYGDGDQAEEAELGWSLAHLGIPIVFSTTTDFFSAPQRNGSVTVDDRAGGRTMTEHLLQSGHTRIAFALVDPAQPAAWEHAWMLRHLGYRDALDESGLPMSGDLLITALDSSRLYSMTNAHRSATAWLAGLKDPVTAVVASCDAVALGVIRALSDAGWRIPEDISVTGFDGLEFSQFTRPSITTFVQPLQEIGERTVDALLRQIGFPQQAPLILTVSGELVVRESSGPAPTRH